MLRQLVKTDICVWRQTSSNVRRIVWANKETGRLTVRRMVNTDKETGRQECYV
jgi:hypothetical protein